MQLNVRPDNDEKITLVVVKDLGAHHAEAIENMSSMLSLSPLSS
jgi:hypothetical protein